MRASVLCRGTNTFGPGKGGRNGLCRATTGAHGGLSSFCGGLGTSRFRSAIVDGFSVFEFRGE